jgi:hypothetical protein
MGTYIFAGLLAIGFVVLMMCCRGEVKSPPVTYRPVSPGRPSRAHPTSRPRRRPQPARPPMGYIVQQAHRRQG